MKFAEASSNTKFRLPPWQAHLAFLAAPSARPFLLLSCVVHAILLGILWNTIDFPLFSGSLSHAQGNPRFDIFLTGAPQVQPATNSNAQSPSHTEQLHETKPTNATQKPPSDTDKPETSSLKPATKAKQSPKPVLPKTGGPETHNHSQPSTLMPSEKAKDKSPPESKSTFPSTASGKPISQATPPLKSANVALSKEAATTTHVQDTVIQDHTGVEVQPSTLIKQKNLHLMITSQVKQALWRHLHYPYIARRRGWDGKVMLGFQVNRQGRLINIHLSKSSGHTVLDSSALSAMREIKQVINMPGLIPEVTAIQHIPVVFQLTQG